MKYKEYLLSARRHSHVCKILQEKILATTVDGGQINNDEINYLALNLYYLSGYIIECSLKFKIFESVHFEDNLDINVDTCRSKGLNYRKKIKIHNFSKLLELLNTNVPDISYASNIDEINELLENWNPELRYEHSNIDYNKILDLYNHTKLFLRQM
ncbi:hypothetical protein JFB93_13805 [Providencia rettgeri]|uniref:hypothetical protein n=1 Tax=Providencia rettgeri TaxID=587 RepID=UPI0018E70B34|nr:hypothetical protein [Providencia rettgeri]QQE92051.1 hypothetical protein JFB93_13805 [Providencia rettgeri]QWJ90510.1 hypothetical protein KM147_13870 [Providencia rettgeri]